ncbi:MAG: hypothetical protein RMM51_07675 [Verrucomicrobiae bacterium]|nr:hypothetical protein [Verrucomicrobiae bacterium]
MKYLWRIWLLCCVLAGGASAQNAAVLWMRPWADVPHVWESKNKFGIQDRADTRNNTSAGIFSWESGGRLKFDADETLPGLAVGYRVVALGVDSSLAAIDGTFWDVSAGLGVRWPAWANGWQFQTWLGGGTANDGDFSNGDGWYGLAVADFSYRWGDDAQVNVGLSYDGNRLFLPDFPLPYVAYRRTLSDELTAVLGLPVGGVVWRPADVWRFEVTYVLPTGIEARAGYRLTESWTVFVEYDSQAQAFAIEQLDNRRLFFSVRRVLGGVEWRTQRLRVSVGAGLAWDQEFERGFDVRELRTVTKVEDVPTLLVQLDARF